MSVCVCIVCICMYVQNHTFSIHTNTADTYTCIHIHTIHTIHTNTYHTDTYIQIHIIHAIHSIHTDTSIYNADTHRYIHIQYCICVYVTVFCIYCVVFVCMIMYVHVYACMRMYVYVCFFWHLHSKKDCTLQVLHALCLASNSKSTIGFQQNAFDDFRSRTPIYRPMTICTTEPLRRYTHPEN